MPNFSLEANEASLALLLFVHNIALVSQGLGPLRALFVYNVPLRRRRSLLRTRSEAFSLEEAQDHIQ